MAATSNEKRRLPPKVAAMKAKKRQREHGGPNGQQPAKKARISGSRISVNQDKLKWRKVPLTGRLEDAEGLCGFLEEVSDVEFSRDEEKGRITFMALPSAHSASTGNHSEEQNNEDDDGEEWRGFEDDASAPSAPSQNGAAQSLPDSKTLPKSSAASDKQRQQPTNHPTSVFAGLEEKGNEGVDTSAWKPLALSPDIRASLSNLRFSQPTPIQEAAIPEILAGKDVIGKASTGSGKTLAFGIPILQQFLENRTGGGSSKTGKTPLALVLSPTRELAHQLEKHLGSLCSDVVGGGPSIATLTGGLSMQKQQRLLKDADIIIGTPGRLWDIVSQGDTVGRGLRQIQYLVVDEADRLLSEGHFKEVEEILNYLEREDEDKKNESSKRDLMSTANPTRQTLVFSATFDRGLQKKLAGKAKPSDTPTSNKDSLAYLLTKLHFRSPEPSFIDVNPINQLATDLTEELVQCEGTEKDLYLYTLLFDRPTHRSLVFANSIDAVRRLTPMLQNLNLPTLALHSEMAQKARLRNVERFTQPPTKPGATGSILIATDVAARGLDIPNVQTVIHYHLPRTADAYVHRSGRTARAGQPGNSIIICEAREVGGVRRLVAKVHARSAVESTSSKSSSNYIRTLDPERRTLMQLKPRLKLAKSLADATMAKQRQGKEDETQRAAAEELGQEFEGAGEFEAAGTGRQGRGKGRRERERVASRLTKAEMGAMRAELRGLLAERVNLGWSPRYLTSGVVDVGMLLREREEGKR